MPMAPSVIRSLGATALAGLAKSAGAKAVNNHIQIGDAAKQKAAANLETGRRRAQIKRGDPRSDVPVKPPPR